MFVAIDLEEIVHDRIARLRCRPLGGTVADILNVHLVDLPRLSPSRRRSSAVCLLVGDWNFALPGDGRFDIQQDSSSSDRAFGDLFPEFAEIVSDWFSRRQFRDGRPQLVRRIDRVYCNALAFDLLLLGASSDLGSALDHRFESDHVPLHFAMATPRDPPPPRIPRWAVKHPMYEAFVHEILGEIGDQSSDVWAQVALVATVQRFSAVQVEAALLHGIAPIVVAHWLLAARVGWFGGRRSRVRRSVARIPDCRHLFTDEVGFHATLPEAEFGRILRALMRQILMTQLQAQSATVDSEERARALRARCLASWSPSQRPIRAWSLLDSEGAPAPTSAALVASLAAHWGPVFSDSRPIDFDAAEFLLNFAQAYTGPAPKVFSSGAYSELSIICLARRPVAFNKLGCLGKAREDGVVRGSTRRSSFSCRRPHLCLALFASVHGVRATDGVRVAIRPPAMPCRAQVPPGAGARTCARRLRSAAHRFRPPAPSRGVVWSPVTLSIRTGI